MKKTWLLICGLLLAACGVGGETAVSPTTATSPPPTTESATEESPIESVAEETPTDTAIAPTATTEQVATEAATATTVPRKTEADYADLEIITLLPPDAIPSIDNPQFITIDEADAAYDPDELVIGVAINGEARAYSVPLLSNHEIVNDVVGGQKIAVTW